MRKRSGYLPKAQEGQGYPCEIFQVVFETFWQSIISFPPEPALLFRVSPGFNQAIAETQAIMVVKLVLRYYLPSQQIKFSIIDFEDTGLMKNSYSKMVHATRTLAFTNI